LTRVTPQGRPQKKGGPRQVPCLPPLKHTTGIDTCLNTFKITAFSHLEHISNMTEYSFYTRLSPEGASGARHCDPPFHVWLPGCCIHPILYFKMPPCGFWPPAAKSWQRAWFCNCIRYRNAKTRQNICSELSV